ncbi:hypothetical protein [Parasitella parasitica]|uniref:Uncharacterized protein n=1 Tax=Parasitella parasitica TaxID=35722 RepID=A0A0B7MV43_9FUNG|nr:hypothetical protein [Parasitella parasitica]
MLPLTIVSVMPSMLTYSNRFLSRNMFTNMINDIPLATQHPSRPPSSHPDPGTRSRHSSTSPTAHSPQSQPMVLALNAPSPLQ